jgi:hypothetical protein
VWPVSSSELNKAYRKLSLLVHPDKAPGPEARQAFEQLKQAYNELKDTDKMVSSTAWLDQVLLYVPKQGQLVLLTAEDMSQRSSLIVFGSTRTAAIGAVASFQP